MNDLDYSAIGLLKNWEIVRRPEWRGWEIVGTNDDIGFVQFIPDKAIAVLIKEVEKFEVERQKEGK